MFWNTKDKFYQFYKLYLLGPYSLLGKHQTQRTQDEFFRNFYLLNYLCFSQMKYPPSSHFILLNKKLCSFYH